MAKANEGNKASLVQCRVEAVQKIDEIVKSEDVSVNRAMKLLAGASGVPYETLKYWYYRDEESKKGGGKIPPTQAPKNTVENKAKVAAKIVRNINKALDSDEEDAMSSSQGQAAQELVDRLGGVAVTEEVYELFLRRIAAVGEVVKANNELEGVVNKDNFINQILRLARNAGWKDPVVDGDHETQLMDGITTTCSKCVVKSCPNRTCNNHKPKKKKKVTK